ALNGSDNVTRIDRTLEGVRALNTADVRDRLYIQQGCSTRQRVFASSGGWSQDVGVVTTDLRDQLSNVLSQLVLISGVVGQQDLADAGNFGGFVSNGSTTATGNQNYDITTANGLGRGNGVQCCALEADRKSTRLNSSHVKISYAVFCLK